MRVLFPVGAIKKGCYQKGMLDISKTGMPSIWKVVLQFAEFNSDRAYFYIGAVCYSNTPGKVEYLPLQGVNGCLVLIHTDERLWLNQGILYMLEKLVHLFSYNSTKPVDCVVLPWGGFSLYFKYYMGFKYNIEHRPALFVRTYNGVTEKPSLRFVVEEPNDYNSLMLSYADGIFTNAHHLKPAYLEMMKADLSFSRIRDVMEKIQCIPHGVPVPEEALDFNRGKVVGYFGRLDDVTKNIQVVFKVFDRLYRSGVAEDVVLTSPVIADKHKKTLEILPYAKLKIMKMEYLEEVKKARATVAHYTSIACPVAMMEQMAYGVVPIVPKNRMWARYFFDAELPDYPFMFSNNSEIYPLLKVLLEDDDLYKKWAEKVSSVGRRFELRQKKRELYDAMEAMTADIDQTPYMKFTREDFEARYRFFPTIEKIVTDLGPEFYGTDFLDEVSKRKVPIVVAGGRQIISTVGLYKMVKSFGYEDSLDSREFKFVRRS